MEIVADHPAVRAPDRALRDGADESRRRAVAARALRLARAAGREAAACVSGARLLRQRGSAHVELPRAGIVARVEAPGNERLAERQAWIGRLLGARGAPVARLARPDLQPHLLAGGAVTLWRRLEPVAAPGFAALGWAVRALHEVTRGSLPLAPPRCDPCRRLRERLARPSPWSGSGASRLLRREAESLASRWRRLVAEDPLGRVVVHGGVRRDNAIATAQGLVLVDLEDAGEGPASWDFAALAVGVQRYGVPAAGYRAFAAGYGREPGAWGGFAVLCRIYELSAVSWAMRWSADSAAMADEAALRVGTVVGRAGGRWTYR